MSNHKQQQGFSYVEVLIASVLIAVALVPAMNALQTGMLSASVHQTLTSQYYLQVRKMEELQAEPFILLLAAAKTAANSKQQPVIPMPQARLIAAWFISRYMMPMPTRLR